MRDMLVVNIAIIDGYKPELVLEVATHPEA